MDQPSCKACGGTGTEAQSVCSVCKGAGRVALDTATATIHEWVQWIREQPSVEHGVAVLKHMMAQDKAPEGLAPKHDD
jgi:DnaJ-class molecular chaperone